jgi:hypothetical protein
MSQRDLAAELRVAHVSAPEEVRERIRLIAAEAPPERRRFTWRLAVAVVVPVAAAVAATVVLTRPAHHTAAVTHGQSTFRAAAKPDAATASGLAVPSAKTRVQQVGTSLSLRVASTTALSDAVRRATQIATSLSGYAASVHEHATGKTGSADLTLKIPRTNVQRAIARLSALGTLTSEQVDVTDKQAGLNASDRTIRKLQAELKKLRAESPLPAKQIAAVTAHVGALQRSEASTRLEAHYATVKLHLATPLGATHHARDWWKLAWAVGGAAVLALLLLAWRVIGRRRENVLLSRT